MSDAPAIGATQPRIVHNDYMAIEVPRIGEWEPSLSVTVVIPAYQEQEKLDLTLAGLKAQTYPSHLLDVVIVDDGSSPALRVPDLAPDRTVMVRSAPDGWGSAHAVGTGVGHARGDVVLRLDADMLVQESHVEAHMRWHHSADYLVVLGDMTFVDFQAGEHTPESVHRSIKEDGFKDLFAADRAVNSWAGGVIRDTNQLLNAGNKAYAVCNGATISWTPQLYRAAGGIDRSLVLGGDTELGYRLAQAGAVFVPEMAARSWHLGIPQMKSRTAEGRKYREPFVNHRMPLRREHRGTIGRQWKVPYADIIVDATHASYEDVRATVQAFLANTITDINVTLVGPWSGLSDERRSPLDDPLLELRLTREAFRHDGRVTMTEGVEETSAPVPFRIICPPGLVPATDAVEKLVSRADENLYGIVNLTVSLGNELRMARLERTEAISRALHLRTMSETAEDVVEKTFGVLWTDGKGWAFNNTAGAKRHKPIGQLHAEVEKFRREAENHKKASEKWKRQAQISTKRRILSALKRRVKKVLPIRRSSGK